MLDSKIQAQIDAILDKLSPQQKNWLADYIREQAVTGEAGASAKSLQIFFATETGNSKNLAMELAKFAKNNGLKSKVQPVGKTNAEQLAKLDEIAVFICSTHGEGEPPEAAKKFYENISSQNGNDFSKLNFAVIALGDSSYPKYCQFGLDLADHFKRLGASEITPAVLLDVDFAAHTSTWHAAILKGVRDIYGEDALKAPVTVSSYIQKPLSTKGYNRLEPVTGIIKDIVNLNDIGSAKETYHIELEFNEPLLYQPGDALGIIPPFEENGAPAVARLYSIASAPSAHGAEIHLTVAHAWHTDQDGRRGFGLCSHYLAGMKTGDEVSCYIHQNHMFRLPDGERDVIMIGPGTGIAPFRSFLFERAENGAEGKNWLFFGEQHLHSDFLYQLELQELIASGLLHDIDLAFSRDTEKKVYVQHRMLQKEKQFIEWLDNGAYLYVCGRKDPMSSDVDAALKQMIVKNKGLNDIAAENYIADLAEEGRYVKDVY